MSSDDRSGQYELLEGGDGADVTLAGVAAGRGLAACTAGWTVVAAATCAEHGLGLILVTGKLKGREAHMEVECALGSFFDVLMAAYGRAAVVNALGLAGVVLLNQYEAERRLTGSPPRPPDEG